MTTMTDFDRREAGGHGTDHVEQGFYLTVSHVSHRVPTLGHGGCVSVSRVPPLKGGQGTHPCRNQSATNAVDGEK